MGADRSHPLHLLCHCARRVGTGAARLGALLDVLRALPDRRGFRGAGQLRHVALVHCERRDLVLRPAARVLGRLCASSRRALRSVVAG